LVYSFYQQLIICYDNKKALTNNLRNSLLRHICNYEVQMLRALPVMINEQTEDVL